MNQSKEERLGLGYVIHGGVIQFPIGGVYEKIESTYGKHGVTLHVPKVASSNPFLHRPSILETTV